MGDNIQSLSARALLLNLSIPEKNIAYVNRDRLSTDDNRHLEPGILIAQGWFGAQQQALPINDESLHPLYFGFHANEGSWSRLASDKEFVASMKKYQPIGCRDFATRDFLRSLGIVAFYSRCLTITLDKRNDDVQPQETYLIDAEPFSSHLPESIRSSGIRLSQEEYAPDRYSPSGAWPMTDSDVQTINEFAGERLDTLKMTAKLVVTTRIHIAMPCVAMGIPVCFHYPNKYDSRASIVTEYFPIYERHELGRIDWNPVCPDIESIKAETKLLFTHRLQQEERKLGIYNSRLSKEEETQADVLLKQACDTLDVGCEYKTKNFSRDDLIAMIYGNQYDKLSAKKIVLFGAGSAGNHMCQVLQYFKLPPLLFCDNSVEAGEQKFCQNKPVISFDLLKASWRDALIFIASIKYFLPIRQQLLEHGFSGEQIVDSSPIVRKYADFITPNQADEGSQ